MQAESPQVDARGVLAGVNCRKLRKLAKLEEVRYCYID